MIGGKKIAKNTLVLIFSSIYSMCVSIFTTSIIAKSIGPELYGRYTFSLNFIFLFSVFSNFGIESLFIRDASRDKNNLHLIMDILYLKILIAIGTILNLIIFAHILNYPDETILVIYILCFGLFFQILYEALTSLYRALEKMEIISLFSIFFRTLSAIIIIISIYSGIGFLGIVSAFSITNAVVFCILFIIVQKKFRILHFNINPEIWKSLIRKGMPFYVSALLTMFYFKINIIILSKMVSEKEMGFFMAALTLVENLLFVPNAFNTSIFPAYSRMFGESPEALRKAYQKITKYLIIITSSVAIGTQIVGAEIIRLIFGDQFSASALILGILIFFWVFTFFSQTQSMLLFSVHKEKEQVMVMGGACFLTILLNFLFITLFGVLGAAYASVIVEAIVVMIFTLILWKIDIKYVPDYHILRLIFSLAGMSIAVIFMLKINFFIAIAFGAFCFLCFLFLFRVFDSEDRYYLKTLLSKEIS